MTRLAVGEQKSFVFLYFLANLGLFIAFVPVLTLLLPEQVARLAPGDEIAAISWLLLMGAIVASAANIIAGLCSDHSLKHFGSRYPVATAGLIATLGSYVLLSLAANLLQLALALALFQTALNFLFSPLAALLADQIPDHVKGKVSGIVALCLPAASLTLSLLVLVPGDTQSHRYLVLGLIVALLVTPLLVSGRNPGNSPVKQPDEAEHKTGTHFSSRDFLLSWTARLLVQIAGATMFGYSYFYIASLLLNTAAATPAEIRLSVSLFALGASICSIGAGLAAGILSDRTGRRLPFLIGAAALLGISTLTLALTANWWLALVAYSLFSIGLTGFLTVETAMVAQIVGKHPRPATALGIMNLTNTLPAALAPAISLILAKSAPASNAISWLLALSAMGAAVAMVIISKIRSVR